MAKKNKGTKTTKPSGMKATRSDGVFSLSWKNPPEGYADGVKYKYCLNTGKHSNGKFTWDKDNWTDPKSIGKNRTSLPNPLSLNYKNYFPYKPVALTNIKFAVQGDAKKQKKKKKTINYKMSDWAYTNYDIAPPKKPTVSVARDTAYTSTVTITPTYTSTDANWATRIEYRTRFRYKNGDTWTNPDWNYSYDGIKSSVTKQINDGANSAIITNYPSARYVQARVTGPAGYADADKDSKGWVEQIISYAAPQPAYDVSASVVDKTNKIQCVVDYKYKTWASNPVSYMKIQYAFATPEADLTPGSDASWEDAPVGGDGTIKPIANKTGDNLEIRTSFYVNTTWAQQPNKLLYIRVVTVHNNRETLSSEVYAKSGNAIPNKNTVVDAPTIDSVSLGSNNLISVTVTNNSAIEGIKIAFHFIPQSDTGFKNMCVYVFSTNTTDTQYSKTFSIPPEYDTSEGFGISAYAFIGSATGTSYTGYSTYNVNATIKSSTTTYGGDIPIPPSSVSADHIGNGNVLITWGWSWTAADYAEVAWSDYEDAIDSTEEPSTHTVPNNKSARLIVRNLEMGKPWYFWVRLIKGENASVWSSPKTVSLTSSPNVPTLEASKEAITMDDLLTLSWAYVSPDNSPQGCAKICTCSYNQTTSEMTYGNPIATIPNEDQKNPETQYVILDPKDAKLNWSSGNTYNLALKVASQAGLESDEWSDPVTVKIVDPITSNILSTTFTPEIGLYDSTSTYSLGDYVFRPIQENTNRTVMALYKAIASISTPEAWDDTHWMVDPDKSEVELDALPLEIHTEIIDGDINYSVSIERSHDYFVDRPDKETYGGYEGEIVCTISEREEIYQYTAVQNPVVADLSTYFEYDSTLGVYSATNDTSIIQGKTYYTRSNGYNKFEIELSDIYGYLDDGASYYLTYRTEDIYGQWSETVYPFKVKWNHQALQPNATVAIEHVVINEDEEKDIAKITINTPLEGTVAEGDVCDIYRISADGVNLVYSGAKFGETYVDPYPTIGEHGGHRIVYRTLYGDYIDANNSFAWLDFRSDETDDIIESDGNIIDFGDGTVKIMFNIDLSNSWSKDFQETKYLGGSIQGDWNSAINMTASMSANVMTNDWNTVSSLRDLANYAGICHVRTRDGMNYLANVDVSERMPYEVFYDPNGDSTHIGEYSLSITKVDPIELDGMTLKDWLDSITDEEIPPDPVGVTGATGSTA